MKYFWLLSCHSIVVLFLMLFTLNAELNFPDTFSIKAPVLGHFALVLDWFTLAMGTLIFGFGILVTNRFCYNLLFRLKVPATFSNDIGLLVAMFLKYIIPMSLVVLLEFNGESVMLKMPVTYTCFRIFMSLSLLFDVLVYTFKYNELSHVTVRIGKWSLVYPCKKIYNLLTFLLWSNFVGTIFWMCKQKYETVKQHQSR
ncbi:hypothetical protein [Chitinophaga caseinilytica]|uniref:Uncharacterized protein n=1 Tax=Chitinophaga caseinilytica TaxID=2267521 RepID=A0ABZ2YXN4_9BACT